MKQDILIVGGYGAVGKHVVMELAKICPENIIIAGRNLNEAERFIKETGLPIRAKQLDIYEPSSFDQNLETIHTVMVCLGIKNTKFAETCIDHGIHYIDISASNEIPSQLKQLEEKAIQNQVTCLLGVGIAPGLSTLLAQKMVEEMEQVTELNFSLMLGLGEQHGTDGVKWFLDNLRTDFEANGSSIKPFIHKQRAHFPEPLGVRKSYTFNLADREILSETLQIPTVHTYFCYDAKFVTGLIHFLQKIRFLSILKNTKVFNFFWKIFSSDAMSKQTKLSDVIGLHIEATGLKSGITTTHYGTITGNNSSALTAKTATYTALQIRNDRYPYGIHYLNEVTHLDQIAEALKDAFKTEIRASENFGGDL